MFYDEDYDTFFNTSEFAVVAKKGDKEFNVIFDEEFKNTDMFDQDFTGTTMSVSISNPDLNSNNIKQGDILYIDYEYYIVKNVRFDRAGVSSLSIQYRDTKDTGGIIDDNNEFIV